jgi:hypothetical protein
VVLTTTTLNASADSHCLLQPQMVTPVRFFRPPNVSVQPPVQAGEARLNGSAATDG